MIKSRVETGHSEASLRGEEQQRQKVEQEEISVIVVHIIIKTQVIYCNKTCLVDNTFLSSTSVFHNFFPMMEPVKQFPMFQETPSHKHENKTTWQLAAHGDYSIGVECWTEIFDIFGIFCCIPVFLFIYSTILAEPLNVFFGTPMVPQNCA